MMSLKCAFCRFAIKSHSFWYRNNYVRMNAESRHGMQQ
jgi:hypothetical protein